jgi:hypothetical protein
MRAKNIRTAAPEPPPPPSSSGMARRVVVVAVLLVLGASFGIVMVKLTSTPSASPSPSPSVALASPSPSAAASGSPGASPSPSPSPSQAAPDLAALMPTSVDGTALTVQTAKDASTLGTSPAPRAISAAVTAFGKKPADFEIAISYDASGSSTLQIFGFRLPGVTPEQLKPVILNAWLAADVHGVTTTTVAIGGKSATKVSYGTGANEYVFPYGDALFDVETADAAVAAKAVAAIGGAPSGSPAASGSPAPSSSPAASGSAAPTASPAPSPSPS